jgi:hypothetical protein
VWPVPHDPRALPEFTSWPTFPFEGDLRVKPLEEPAAVEPPRQGEDPEACTACQAPDVAYIWVSDRWRVRALDRPSGLPMVLILESRSHLDIGDLPNLWAAELGVMTVRLERAIRSIEGVARVHINRWGDGSAHLHLWFLARPYGRLQLRGTFLSLWDDILPPIAEVRWRENLALVAAWLAEFGGRPLAEPPPMDWKAPTRLDPRAPLTVEGTIDVDQRDAADNTDGAEATGGAKAAVGGGAGAAPGTAEVVGEHEAGERAEPADAQPTDTPEPGPRNTEEPIETTELQALMGAAEVGADDEAVVRVRPRPVDEGADQPARAPASQDQTARGPGSPDEAESAERMSREAADQVSPEPAGQGTEEPRGPAETGAAGEARAARTGGTGTRRRATAAGPRAAAGQGAATGPRPDGQAATTQPAKTAKAAKAAKANARQRVLAPDPADPEEAWEDGV